MTQKYYATDHEKQTRGVFHTIHKGHLETKEGAQRVRTLLNTKDLKLPENFFHGKLCADLGCGSAGSGTYNLLKLGANFVHAMDLNDSFIETVTGVLKSESDFKNRWQLDVGSVERLPYENEFFDFVLCQGVIHHVDDDSMALREIFRVLKKGGVANLMVHGEGGLLTRFVMEILRDEYIKNPSFVNNDLSSEEVSKQIDWLVNRIDDDGSEVFSNCINLLELLKDLINEDTILTLKDRLQAPLYKMYTEDNFKLMLKEAGFSSSYRVSRKPIFKNIRKILSPLYHEYNASLARLLYGEGMITIMATK